MEEKDFEGKTIYWTSKWDKLWLLIFPTIFLIDIFRRDYPKFWFWFILILLPCFIGYILYHMFHPKFVWVDMKSKEGKGIVAKSFEYRLKDLGYFEYTEDGFNFTNSKESAHIKWTDIEAVFGYKRDLYTIDELNLELFIKEGLRLNINEESPGWYVFIGKLKEVFPGIDKEFEIKLMFPPFETNLTLIYNATEKTQEVLIEQYYTQYGE